MGKSTQGDDAGDRTIGDLAHIVDKIDPVPDGLVEVTQFSLELEQLTGETDE